MVWLIALLGMALMLVFQAAGKYVVRQVRSGKVQAKLRRTVYFAGALWRLKNPTAAWRVTRAAEWEHEWIGGRHA
jgi:hypothetical protein